MKKWFRKGPTNEDISRAVLKEVDTQKLEHAHQFLSSLKDWRAKEKIYNTYVLGIKDALDYNKDGKIYANFNFDGTVTGRLSCGAYVATESKGISFHTLPRVDDEQENIRSLVKSPDGYAFITSDYKAMELRILAHVCRDKNMIKAFYSGEDLHKYTASLIFKKSVDAVTKQERQIAKSASFLMVYGGGAFRLSKTVNIPINQAEKILEAYVKAFPDVFTWMDEVRAEVVQYKYAKSLFGRRRNLPGIDSPIKKIQVEAERQGINFKIQSAASDVLLAVSKDIQEEYTKRGIDAYNIANVHDSYEGIASLTDLEESLQIIYNKMTTYPTISKVFNFICVVPLEIEVEVGKNFGKGIEVKYGKSGQVLNMVEVKDYFNAKNK